MTRISPIAQFVLLLGLVVPGLALAAPANQPPKPTAPEPCSPRTSGFDFSLRSDFTDLGPLGPCTQDKGFLSAQGATISGANNLLTGQYSAALDGLAAFDYRYYGSEDLIGYAIGPFVQGNNTYQFEPTKTQTHNGYTVTTGGYGEIAFADAFTRGVQGIDDFRFRGGEVEANTGTTSESIVAEWIPSYALGRPWNIGLPNQLGATALSYTPTPELMIQYDRLLSGPNKFTIFSTRNEAFRIGPQISLKLTLDESALPSAMPPWLKSFLGHTSALITNHESWDAYTNKEYSWTSVSFTYTLPDFSHFGITASYGYGNLEQNGNKGNQVKLGLAAKF
ncbi:MAG TPA: hypothetical protein VH206_09525 [Xanthobacteraceae bacterium]|jgi:hypothetical protein|nr:hypothetical protein [Xanthobacteraceae bacterium]